MKRETKSNILWVAGLAIIALFVFSYIFNPKPDMNGDNCYYFANATSLASGDGYADMFGNPTTNFPPGYPLLMAPLRMATDSIVAQKILNLLFLFAGVTMLFFILINENLKKSVAFLACAAVLVTPHLLEFSTMMMSEASCFCCLTLIYLLYQKLPLKDDKALWSSPLLYLFLAALVFVYYIRTQAAAIVAAFVVALLFARRWKLSLAVVAAFVAGYLPWFLRNEALNLTQSRYVSQIDFSNIFSTLKMLVIQAVPESIIPFVNVSYGEEPSVGLWLFAILWMTIILYGFWSMRRLRLPLILFLLGTLGIISIINTPSQYRYIVTILPFLTAGLFVGLYNIGCKCARRMGAKGLNPWVLALLFLPILTQTDKQSKRTLTGLHVAAKAQFPPQFQNFIIVGKALYNHNKNAIVATRKPELLYINSGVRGKHFKETEDDTALIRDLLEKNVDYVIIDQLGYAATYHYLLPCVQRNPDIFRVVMHQPNPDTYLLFFDKKQAANKVK